MQFIITASDLGRCRITSPFGNRNHPIFKQTAMHRAIDIAMPQGTQLLAPADGVVHMNRTNGRGVNTGYGHYLVLHHPAENIYTLYAHLRSRSTIQTGGRVTAGQVVAESGNTGMSTGPHLHFETHRNRFLFRSQATNGDSAVDPMEIYPQLRQYIGRPSLTGLQINTGPSLVVNGKQIDVPLKNVGGRVFAQIAGEQGQTWVQIRALGELLGGNITWIQETQTVVIRV